MRVGVLVSGGDCPGLNAAVRGAVLHGVEVHGHEYIGYLNGWQGVVENRFMKLDRRAVRGISQLGGTILGSSRVSPIGDDGIGVDGLKAHMRDNGIDAFLLIGGNGTHTVGHILSEAGIPIVGLPKTIDNDIVETDYTFGYDTAVSIATEAIDRLRTTGQSHRRCMVLEVMGRDAGWIALSSGIAGGAHTILIPEFPETIDQVAQWVAHVHGRGRSALVVVAEGFQLKGQDATTVGVDHLGRPRYGGVAEVLAPMIEEETGIETRATVLGHVQRGGVPTAFDRVLATRVGIHGADALNNGQFGKLVVSHGTSSELVPLETVAYRTKNVPEYRYAEMRRIFG